MTTLIKHNAGKFFLMENCPEPLCGCDPMCKYPFQLSGQCRQRNYESYEQSLQSIPAIEIVNPELLPLTLYINEPAGLYAITHNDTQKKLEDNDTFLLPETVGYEKEYQYRERRPSDMKQLEWKKVIYTMDEDGHEFRTVARLYVKAEKGETQEYDNEDHLWAAVHTEFLYVDTEGVWAVIDRLKSKYTITRKP